MMFATLQLEIGARILSTKAFFDAISPPPSPSTPVGAASVAIQVAKGTVFVLLYAVYERTVNAVFLAAVQEVKKHNLQFNEAKLGLLSLGLHAEFTAAVECGPKRIWDTRIEFLLRSGSTDTMTVDESVFPKDGSHYREKQLETIWRIFGMTLPAVPHPRFGTLVNELVDNRNAIAHGRRTADDVGSGYSADDIRRKIGETQDLCLHLCTQLQLHCATAANLKR